MRSSLLLSALAALVVSAPGASAYESPESFRALVIDVVEHDKEYVVRFAGPDKPYRLAPLRRITSPAKGARQECTYSLTLLHPDREEVLTGSYQVPQEK